MKRKVVKHPHQFDDTEFLLLAFVAVALLAIVAWQGNLLPPFLTQAVLGVATVR